MQFPAYVTSLVKKDLAVRAVLRGAMIEAVLLDHRLRHGRYPERLGGLDLPRAARIDPFDPQGRGFRYRRVGAGYLLYSGMILKRFVTA